MIVEPRFGIRRETNSIYDRTNGLTICECRSTPSMSAIEWCLRLCALMNGKTYDPPTRIFPDPEPGSALADWKGSIDA